MNASYRFLSVFLIISLMFGCSALADQTGTAAGEAPAIQSDSPAGLFLEGRCGQSDVDAPPHRLLRRPR